MNYIQMRDPQTGRDLHPKCPYGVRDLHNDVCYSGMGKNRCEYFVKYEHYLTGEIARDGTRVRSCMSYIVCKCNKPKRGTWVQLSLFD